MQTALEVLLRQRGPCHGPDGRRLHAHPRHFARHPHPQPGQRGSAAGADGVVITPSHNPPGRRRLQVQPALRRSRRHHASPTPSRSGPTRSSPSGRAAVNRLQFRAGRGHRASSAATTTSAPTSKTSRNVLDMEAIQGGSLQARLRPDGRQQPSPFWAPIAERYNLDIEVVNDRGRPDLRLHAARPRRQNPHGLLLALCHGQADRAQGPLRRGLGQRPRCGPARHRDPLGRAAQPEPLPGRRDPATCSATGPPGAQDAAWARRSSPRRSSTGWPPRSGRRAGRSARRVQVVRRRPARRFATASAGEESAGASFLRADGDRVDHRQGRHHHGPAGRGDHCRHGQGPRRALPGDRGASSAAPSTPASTRRPAARRKSVLANLSPDLVAATELAGEPILAKLTRAPGNNAPIGGLKVATENGWFAARPSGTEDVYKIYAESFRGDGHLRQLQDEAQSDGQCGVCGGGRVIEMRRRLNSCAPVRPPGPLRSGANPAHRRQASCARRTRPLVVRDVARSTRAPAGAGSSGRNLDRVQRRPGHPGAGRLLHGPGAELRVEAVRPRQAGRPRRAAPAPRLRPGGPRNGDGVRPCHGPSLRLRRPPPTSARSPASPSCARLSVEEVVYGTSRFDWIETELGAELLLPGEPTVIYLAYDEGVPAAAAWMRFHEGTDFAALFGGSTLPDCRNRGLYTALLAVRAQEARRRGYRFLTVDAGDMSPPDPRAARLRRAHHGHRVQVLHDAGGRKGDSERRPSGKSSTVFLRLGLTAFGGPAAHIAIMHDEIVTPAGVARRGGVPRPARRDQPDPRPELDRNGDPHRLSGGRAGPA